jgi:hypothetical protein
MTATAVAMTIVSPAPGGAQEPSTEEQLGDVRQEAGDIAAQIDVLEAEDAEIQTALAAIQMSVVSQQVVVNAANDALAVAEADLAASTQTIGELESQIVTLDASVDQMVIQAYMDPPMDHIFDAFRAETLTEATVKDALVEIQARADVSAIETLDDAQVQLEEERVIQEELVTVADERKAEADQAMADLQAGLDQQTAFAAEVQTRLAGKIAEAQALQAQDAALAQQLLAEQAALADSLSQSSSGTSSAPGGLGTASCPAGGSITVAGTIVGNVQALLDASWAGGVSMCGGGYRDPQQQIDLRREHCGTSNYAIYEMPSSQCDPPTARPGSSMHEVGLAIDFTCDGGGSVDSGDSCWNWLSAHADEYGLYNLPSEPWHWSTNGN